MLSILYSLGFPLFLLCFSTTTTAKTSFEFQTLGLINLKLLGDAHIYNNATIRLTGDLTVPNTGAGMVLFKDPVRFRQPGNPNASSFTTYFTFSIATLNPNSNGGGLSFLMSPRNDVIGAPGGFLGVPPCSIALEFDTFKDVEFNDVNGNHVGLDIGSPISLNVTDLDSVNINLRSGELIHVWVDYSGRNHQLKSYISDSKTKPTLPVLAVTIDLYPYVNELMSVGFSGSTQGSTEYHSISYWKFASDFEDSGSQIQSNYAPKSALNATPIFMPPITTHHSSHKFPAWLELGGIIFGFVALNIVFYFTYICICIRGDEKRNYNICNWCSEVNNT